MNLFRLFFTAEAIYRKFVEPKLYKLYKNRCSLFEIGKNNILLQTFTSFLVPLLLWEISTVLRTSIFQFCHMEIVLILAAKFSTVLFILCHSVITKQVSRT